MSEEKLLQFVNRVDLSATQLEDALSPVVEGLGDKIVAAREDGPFVDAADFRRRIAGVGPARLNALINLARTLELDTSVGGGVNWPPLIARDELGFSHAPLAAVALRGAEQGLDRAEDLMWDYASLLVDKTGPSVAPGPPARVAEGRDVLRAEAERVRRVALDEVRAVKRFFNANLRLSGAPPAELAAIREVFEPREQAAQISIEDHYKYALATIDDMTYWAQHQSAENVDLMVPALRGFFDVVWTHQQRHRISGTIVRITKGKVNVRLFGNRVNVGGVAWHPPAGGTAGPAKILRSMQAQTPNGRTTVALDSASTEAGNVVQETPARTLEFYGYLKVFYTEGVPANCRIIYQQVAYCDCARCPAPAPGADRRWQRLSSTRMFRDGPPGGTTNDLGNGRWGHADFPNSGPPGPGACSYTLRADLFRTWVLEECEDGATTVLGYWEWSYRQLLHLTATGVEEVPTNPRPAGLPAPPAGWPTPDAPSAGPTRWVDAADAPAELERDRARLYP